MKVTMIDEYGYDIALLGNGLSYGKTSCMDINDLIATTEVYEAMDSRAAKLAGMGNAHNKFMRMVSVWLDISAPLYWWSQFDTYKVGTCALSESKMHTIMRRELFAGDFENGITPGILGELNDAIRAGNFSFVVSMLPMSFIQRRIVSANYEVLANIIRQREGHKLPEWKVFIDSIKAQACHPELLK